MEKSIVDNTESLEKQQRIGEFFKPTNHPLHDKVIRAEVKLSTVLAHHNIPIAVSDHLSSLFKDIFPDSEIAKAYSCAQTKTTCILNGALAPRFRSSLVEHMMAEPSEGAIYLSVLNLPRQEHFLKGKCYSCWSNSWT